MTALEYRMNEVGENNRGGGLEMAPYDNYQGLFKHYVPDHTIFVKD